MSRTCVLPPFSEQRPAFPDGTRAHRPTPATAPRPATAAGRRGPDRSRSARGITSEITPMAPGRPAAGTGPGAESGTESLAEFFDRLYAQERNSLQRYVCSLVGNDTQRAEDVVQETLLRAWLAADRMIRERVPVRAWLWKVARNIVIDWHRRDMARPHEVEDTQLVWLATPDDEMEHVLDRAVVSDALRTLPEPYREVLYHVHCCGRTGQETAELVGVPRGTVKSRTHYASRALRKALNQRGLNAA